MAAAKGTVPVRIEQEQLDEVKKRADAGNRAVSRELKAIIAAGLKATAEDK